VIEDRVERGVAATGFDTVALHDRPQAAGAVKSGSSSSRGRQSRRRPALQTTLEAALASDDAVPSSRLANFTSASGALTVFLVLAAFLYTASIIFLVGVEIDELLRKDASATEEGIISVLRRGMKRAERPVKTDGESKRGKASPVQGAGRS
jgi:hypothetical protein